MNYLAFLIALGLISGQTNPRNQISPETYWKLTAVAAVPAFLMGLAAQTPEEQVTGNYAALGTGAAVGLAYASFTGLGRLMISADSGRDPGSFGLPNPLVTTAVAFVAFHAGRTVRTLAQKAHADEQLTKLARALKLIL